ncbi:GNAT family N-acetyltransferase [Pseudoalteromonas sp. HM-SA03]|uniref:GNAT family N-acetyltransferase n=1 Tax=Pseudoalteromonas sp. HM-SA03 TaxID=2029678 RepID=UPI000BAE1DBD|nr:GNAT family N-acetyltransferase [Pseudoalteromonas sp. HM-SA03]PAY01275.1 GNAT family N-acetyltransferase [Pseudoalteromonas sp. HM-SA03]
MAKLDKYRMVACAIDESWDSLVRSSNNSTPFALSCFINSLDGNFSAFICKKGDEVVAGCLLALDSLSQNVIGHELVVHDGIFVKELKDLNQAQKSSEEFKALQCIAEFLVDNYSSVQVALSPLLQDIRPFQWVHYHDDKPMYVESIRYTCKADIKEFKELKQPSMYRLYEQASVSRRQAVRYSYRDQVVVNESVDVEAFLNLYCRTFERQKIKLDENILPQMRRLLTKLLKSENALMVEAKTECGSLASMAVFVWLGNTAYYLFGANDFAYRNTSTGTAVLWQAFTILAKLGIEVVDFEGVNSPDRGWFKLSFGAVISPYYCLSYQW